MISERTSPGILGTLADLLPVVAISTLVATSANYFMTKDLLRSQQSQGPKIVVLDTATIVDDAIKASSNLSAAESAQQALQALDRSVLHFTQQGYIVLDGGSILGAPENAWAKFVETTEDGSRSE